MGEQTVSPPSLFVWRAETTESWGAPTQSWKLRRCMWCRSKLKGSETKHPVYPWTYDETENCGFCGWFHRRVNFVDENRYPSGDVFYIRKEIRGFQIDDRRVLLAELGAHLQRRYRDVYAVRPRRFEELVEDVFKRSGYRTQLTAASRDGGVDIYLLGKQGHDEAIVEVKRYAQERKVGIAIVDRLRGVQLRKGIRHAKIVTSSTFSQYAMEAAEAMPPCELGFTMELVDAGKLLETLGVYDERLIPFEEAIKKWKLLTRNGG